MAFVQMEHQSSVEALQKIRTKEFWDIAREADSSVGWSPIHIIRYHSM
jgi:hypothetical protein